MHYILSGFGRAISFSDEEKVPPGYTMSFKEALNIVSCNLMLPLVLPNWIMSFTKKLRDIRTATTELKRYMQEMIDERQSGDKRPERHDLFSNLLEANMEEMDGEAKLKDNELIGE